MNEREREALLKKQANVYRVLDAATKPAQIALDGIQAVLMVIGVAVVLIVLPFVWWFHSPAVQEKANTFFMEKSDYVAIDFATNSVIDTGVDALDDTSIDQLLSHIPDANDATRRYQMYLSRTPIVSNHRDESVEKEILEFGSSGFSYSMRMPPIWAVNNLIMDAVEEGGTSDWATGKSLPMYRALVAASTSSAALRSTLEDISGRAPKRRDIRINAPQIKVIYSTRLGQYHSFVVLGMCPVRSCEEEDLHFHVAHDIMTPSVTKGQQAAIDQLNYTLTDAYWTKESHRNGIYGRDESLRTAAAKNRDAVNDQLNFGSDEQMMNTTWKMLLFFGWIPLAVYGLLLWGLVWLVRFIFF